MKNRVRRYHFRQSYHVHTLPTETMKEVEVQYHHQPPKGDPKKPPPERRYTPQLPKGDLVPDPDPSPPVEFGKPVYVVPRERK
jgi:hypothetical protein